MVHPPAKEQAESIKVVVFTIAGYRLALPMESVLRVVNCPPELLDSQAALELVNMGQLAIAVLNLQSHLRLQHTHQPQSSGHFLIVAKAGDELCAVRVDTPPDLMELTPSMIRQLPAPYRQGHPLTIASQVAVLPQGKATLAIFLLNLKHALEVVVR
jgi:chemotaxis signal transduction protein